MDLNELKNAWSQYDRKLTENLNLNKELFKRLNMDKSKNELNKLLNTEIISIVVSGLLLPFMIIFSINIIDEIQISICGFIVATILLIWIIFSGMKINRISKINYYTTPVVQLQKQITSLKLSIAKLRKIEFSSYLPFCIILLPIACKLRLGIDVFNDGIPTEMIIRLIIGLVIGMLLSILFCKYYYDKKIVNAQQHLQEIEQFQIEKEE